MVPCFLIRRKNNTLATDTAYEDQNKLTEAVKNLKCMQKDNMEKPADACIKDNGETYEIQPEKEGTTLDTKKGSEGDPCSCFRRRQNS